MVDMKAYNTICRELEKAKKSLMNADLSEVNALMIIVFTPYEVGGYEHVVVVRGYSNYGDALMSYAETPCMCSTVSSIGVEKVKETGKSKIHLAIDCIDLFKINIEETISQNN